MKSFIGTWFAAGASHDLGLENASRLPVIGNNVVATP